MKIFDFQSFSQGSNKMKLYLFLIAFIALILLVGCKASVQAPAAQSAQDQQNAVQAESNDSMPEVPEEWKGKTIAEIMNISEPAQSEENETAPATNATNNAYSVPKGTYIVEARKVENSLLFFPREIKIKVGETIRFVNNLDYQNKLAKMTLYSHQNAFRSPSLKYGEYFEHTFNSTGYVSYNVIPYQDFFKNGEINITE